PESCAVGRLDGLDGPGQGVTQVERHAKFVDFTEIPAQCEDCPTIFLRIALTFPMADRYRDRGLAAMHRSPGGVTCEASFPARRSVGSANRRGARPARRASARPAPILRPCAAGS